jgi:hypothetical protein
MDITPWRVKLTVKPIMAVMTASNPVASPVGFDVGLDRRQGGWGAEGQCCALGGERKRSTGKPFSLAVTGMS